MKPENQTENQKYYTDPEIAELLGISLGRLRNKISAGQALPPRIQPPGFRQRLWPSLAVHEWLDQYMISTMAPAGNATRRRR